MELHPDIATTLHDLDDTVFELLDPIHQLSAGSRRKLAANAKTFTMQPGQRLESAQWKGKLLFLLNGEIERRLHGRAPEMITELHASVSKPLFADAEERGSLLLALGDCELIAFDRRLFELLQKGEAESQTEVDFIETSAFASALFQDLFKAYSERKLVIPSLPDIAERISQAVRKPGLTEKEMAQLVATDPSLAARVMSAAYLNVNSSKPKRHNLLEAVQALGMFFVRDLAISHALLFMCSARSPLITERLRRAYAHSIHVAAFSYVLARKVPALDPEQALLAGLLHDVGAFPVLCAADAYMDDAENQKELDSVVWRLHGVVGSMVLQQWGFDEELVKTAESCDDWRRNPGPQPDYADIVLVAQLHSFIGTQRMKGLPQFASIPAFRKLAGAEPAPQFSLRVFNSGRNVIARLENMLRA
jgi:putative nucleotidyltransferase with HDIG domain